MHINHVLVRSVISDIGNGYINGTRIAAHLIGGAAIGIAVSVLTNKKREPGVQRGFSIKMNSGTKFDLASFFKLILMKTVAVASAATISYYLAPHSRFVKFSAGRFSYLFMLFMATVLGGVSGPKIGMRKRNVIPLIISGLGIAGMISGRCGHYSLIPFAAIGAAFSSIPEKKKNDFPL